MKKQKNKSSKKNPLNTKRQFDEALSYIKEARNYIYASLAIFIVSASLGFIFSEYLTFIDEILKEIIYETQNMKGVEHVFFILQNNLQAAIFAVVYGIVFGIAPIFYAVSNGAVIGYVLARSYELAGLSSWLLLVPHGIFELPAIFISFGLGIKLGFSVISKNRNRIFYKTANAFLMVVLPLLIIAAIIEGILIALL